MPFPSFGLAATLLADIAAFAANNNFPDLYRSYSWRNDTYVNQFPDILGLELQLSGDDKSTGITLTDVQAVAAWGAMRNPGRINGAHVSLPALTLHTAGGVPQPALAHAPATPIIHLQNVNGIGPTYQSKVLRFGMPAEYGAIDTRCVRVFGQGDPAAQQHRWLTLSATQGQHNGRAAGWSIPENQAQWPNGFTIWINILRRFAQILPANCPHPAPFVDSGMRAAHVWTCADVEMALFAYASQFT